MVVAIGCLIAVGAPVARAATIQTGPGAGAVIGPALPVVYDTDMDFDDSMALAYLAGEAHTGRIKLLAVTVEVDGAGLPILGPAHAACILSRAGLGSVPIAEAGLPLDVNIVPPEFRAAAEAVIEPALLPCIPGPVVTDAAHVLARAILGSTGPVTVLTTGPLTNVAAALKLVRATPGGLAHVGHVYSMLGAIHVSGGLCCTTTALANGRQELNAWIDPAADNTVLDMVGQRWTLIPVDATNDVPITTTAVKALTADRSTPEASIVASLASSPLFDLSSVEQAYFWDPLAAVFAVTGQAVSLSSAHLRFVPSGSDAGRTVVDASGPLMTFGTRASESDFLRLFRAGLDLKG